MRRVLTGLAAGLVVGALAATVLLPEQRQRALALVARLPELDGPTKWVDLTARLAREVIDEAQARYTLALAEARRAKEETQRELWTRLEAAKQRGQLPPG